MSSDAPKAPWPSIRLYPPILAVVKGWKAAGFNVNYRINAAIGMQAGIPPERLEEFKRPEPKNAEEKINALLSEHER